MYFLPSYCISYLHSYSLPRAHLAYCAYAIVLKRREWTVRTATRSRSNAIVPRQPFRAQAPLTQLGNVQGGCAVGWSLLARL